MNTKPIKFAAAALLLALRAVAQPDTVSVMREVDIEEVRVARSRIQKEVIPVQLLEGQQLKRLSVHSVADAVRYFSGVQIKDYGGIGGLKTVNVRSLGSHHVGVFYDGIELGNAQNGVVDLGRFSLDNMEAVSMYNGQKSAIFQPAKDYASASALYLQTRMPRLAEGQRHRLSVGMSVGSFDTYNPSLLWEQRIGQRVSSSVSAELMRTSGRYKFTYAKKDGYDTTAVRQNGDVLSMRAEAGLFGQMRRGEWRAKLYVYNSERGYPGASVREEPGKFKHQDRQWDNNMFVQATLRQQFGTAFSLLLNGKYAYDYLHYVSDPRLDVTTMYVDNTYRQQEAYASMVSLYAPVDWWSASVATDYQFNTLSSDMANFVHPQRHSVLTALATAFDFFRMKLQASLLHTYTYDITRRQGSEAAAPNSRFTPSLIASWRPFWSTDLNLRAFYKRVFRLPTFNDLYYTFIGNIRLKPEYTTQYNIGATYANSWKSQALRRIELQLDAYYNQVEDKIIAMPTSNQFRWTMLNLGYVEIHGIDAGVQSGWAFGPLDMDLRLSYTFQRAADNTDPQSQWYGGQVPYIPWHSGSVIAAFNWGNWAMNYSFIYTGERYEAVANIPENYSLPWYTHDLSLSYSNLRLAGIDWRITLEANNILNQQYEVVQCYPMPGINFKLKLNANIW